MTSRASAKTHKGTNIMKRPSILSLAFFVALAATPGAANAFAALAVDTSKGSRHGWWAGDTDKAHAQSSARNQCGSGCGVVLTWDTGCAAYNVDMAAGSSITAFGTGLTSNQAKSNARRACLDKGGVNCTTRVWACDRNANSPVSGGTQ